MLEYIAVLALHQLNIIFGQLERRPLEIHVARRAGKHEAEVNVDDMAEHIDQNIVVVPIFDIKKVLDETVPCQRLYKVSY